MATRAEVLAAIKAAAANNNVDFYLAQATAIQESGLNPDILGDGGHSVGLFQLNDYGEGAGHSHEWSRNPFNNASVALAAFNNFRRSGDPSTGGYYSPGAWAAASERPCNEKGEALIRCRAAYAAKVDAIYQRLKAAGGGDDAGVLNDAGDGTGTSGYDLTKGGPGTHTPTTPPNKSGGSGVWGPIGDFFGRINDLWSEGTAANQDPDPGKHWTWRAVGIGGGGVLVLFGLLLVAGALGVKAEQNPVVATATKAALV